MTLFASNSLFLQKGLETSHIHRFVLKRHRFDDPIQDHLPVCGSHLCWRIVFPLPSLKFGIQAGKIYGIYPRHLHNFYIWNITISSLHGYFTCFYCNCPCSRLRFVIKTLKTDDLLCLGILDKNDLFPLSLRIPDWLDVPPSILLMFPYGIMYYFYVGHTFFPSLILSVK